MFGGIDREDILAGVLIGAFFFFHRCTSYRLEGEDDVEGMRVRLVKQTIVGGEHGSLGMKREESRRMRNRCSPCAIELGLNYMSTQDLRLEP